ncbi:dienelactone hydrolase family protein [soil metagenome]
MAPRCQKVSFPRAERLEGYLSLPDGSSGNEYPGVVVVHEFFGLNDNIRGVANRLTGEGYAALAVDLFAGRKRTLCMARFIKGMLTDSLDHGAIRDLKASLSYLAGFEEVDPARLGAVGFSLGGSFVNAWACTDDRLKVVASYYGMNPRPLEAVQHSCPVVGSYPEKDFTGAQARKLEQELESHGVARDIKVYPEARHSFFNENRPRVHDPEASDDSWRRTLEFFDRHIGRQTPDEKAS